MATNSYKDMILREDVVPEVYDSIERYSYEELMNIIDNKNKRVLSLSELKKKDFLFEKADELSELLSVFKDKYITDGFLDTISCSHLYKILERNITVEEIHDPMDDNENNDSNDDDEIYPPKE